MFQNLRGLTISGKDIKIGLKGGGNTNQEFSGTNPAHKEQQTSIEKGEKGTL